MSLSRAEFSRMVADHGATLYRVAFRLIGHAQAAEDVVQETFRSAWTSRDHFAARDKSESPHDEQALSENAAEQLTDDATLHDWQDTTLYESAGRQHEPDQLLGGDPQRAAYDSERAWLLAILRRRVADRWRRKDRLVTTETTEIAFEPPDPIELGYSDEMQHALDRVPHDLRECLLLVVVGELTHQEVADLLGLPLGTVLSRVSRARNRLREFFLALKKS